MIKISIVVVASYEAQNGLTLELGKAIYLVVQKLSSRSYSS